MGEGDGDVGEDDGGVGVDRGDDDALQKKYTSVMIRVCHSRSHFCHACTSMTNL